MTQNFRDLCRDIAGTCEQVFVAHKPKEVGITSYFWVDQFSGASVRPRDRIDTHKQFYKEEIFALYSSYTAPVGVESKSDARENILAKRSRLIMLVVIVCLTLGALFYVWKFFNPALSGAPAAKSGIVIPAPAPKAEMKKESVSAPVSRWRVEGYYVVKGEMVVVVVDAARNRRYVDAPTAIFLSQRAVNVLVDGEMVTRYSGASSSLLGGGGK
jgi:zona occludens toxin (predicted ATPase)